MCGACAGERKKTVRAAPTSCRDSVGCHTGAVTSNDVDIEACDAAKGEPTATKASLVEELVPSGARP